MKFMACECSECTTKIYILSIGLILNAIKLEMSDIGF